jgi:proline racemase
MTTMVTTTDYHTAGEPFRIVTAGVATPRGRTAAERRRWAIDHLDDVRALLCREPRGHADMYGCFLAPPDDEAGDLATVFFHNDGFSTACGHGTIALATWAVETGLVVPEPGATAHTVVIDVPSGRVEAVVALEDGRPGPVRFRNVPASVHTLDLQLEVEGRTLHLDVSYGGAYYASCDADQLGLEVVPLTSRRPDPVGSGHPGGGQRHLELQLPRRQRATRAVRRHLLRPAGCISTSATSRCSPTARSTGPPAAAAPLRAWRCWLRVGRSASATPSSTTRSSGPGSSAGPGPRTAADGTVTYDTEVEGRAARTGQHTFVLDPNDELGDGFVLR